MAAPTAPQRPTALPTNFPKATQAKTPAGAARMARTYVDDKGLPQRSLTPVPVDENDRRTAHLLMQCPHMIVVNGGGKERCTEKEWLLPDEKAPYCRRHGQQLEPEKAGPSELELMVREALTLHGRSAAPWLIPAGAAIADTIAHLAAVNMFEAALSAPVLAGGAYLLTKRVLTARAVERGRLEKGQRTGRRVEAITRRAWAHAALGVEAGLWLTALAGTDITHLPGIAVAGLGMARWAFACRDWWMAADARRERGTNQPDTLVVDAAAARQAPVEPPDPVKLRALTTWQNRIGCPTGPLAGTELVDFKRLPNCMVGANERTILPNWSAKVVATEAGSINMRESRPTLLGRIAAAYGVSYADVSFAADEADLSVAWVRVQPDNPLAETRMWTGPVTTSWGDGVSTIGRFDDGRPILYQWFDEGGACHDLLGGGTGSGKSEAVVQMMLTSLHSNGLVLDWLGDPQGGQSYGAVKDELDWFARDKTEIKLMLLAAVKEMWRRNDVLSGSYIKTWRPTKDMPLLVITLDEVQDYIDDPDITELVKKLAGQSRKCGIKMRLITQIIAAYNLGGDSYIKELVKSGQTLTFRSETDIAARSAVEGDSPIDPTLLPKRWGPHTCAAGKKTAGLVYMQGIHGRDVYGRTDYTGENLKPWLVDGDGNATVTPGRFSAEAQKVSGVLWGDRIERACRLIEAGRDDADLLPNGRAAELIEQAAVAAVSGTPVRAADPGQPKLQDRARDRVLAAAHEQADDHGTVTKAAIAAAVRGQIADSTLDKALMEAVAAGDLIRVKNGVYALLEPSGTPRGA